MRKIKRITCIYVFLICAVSVSSKTSIPELYKEFNLVLSKRDFYIDLQQKKIDSCKVELRNARTLKEQHEWSKKLTTEYSYFNADSVLFYSNKTMDIATEMKDEDAYFNAFIGQAFILSWLGYFHEPIKIMESINVDVLSPKLRQYYYSTSMLIYYYRQRQIMNAHYRLHYRAETLKYTDLFLAAEPVTAQKSRPYLSILGYKYFQLKDYNTALDLYLKALNGYNMTPLSKINLLYLIYMTYKEMGEDFEEDAESYLLQSAILGVKSAKLNESSIQDLALIQSKNGNYSLALKYIDATIANMEFCQNLNRKKIAESARLTIQEAYYKEESKEQNNLYYIMILVLILSLLPLGAFIYMLKKNRLLRTEHEEILKNSNELSISNKKLSTSNSLKNSYIAYYLGSSSYYINKLDEMRTLTIRKISTKQSTDLLKANIEGMIDIKEERQKLYRDFDKTFYEIYPDFIEKVNSLMQSEYQFDIDDVDIEKNRTSTELKILALIKLGINDNKQIALFLQFTIQSVYNYRSKIKSRTINPDNFEDELDRI